MAIFELSESDLVPSDTYKPKFHELSNQWSILNKVSLQKSFEFNEALT